LIKFRIQSGQKLSVVHDLHFVVCSACTFFGVTFWQQHLRQC